MKKASQYTADTLEETHHTIGLGKNTYLQEKHTTNHLERSRSNI